MKKHSRKSKVSQAGGGKQSRCKKSPAAELIENLMQLHKLQKVLLAKLQDQIR